MAHHIGDQRCQKLPPYTLQLYELIVENGKHKGIKRKPNVLMTTADHKSRGKSSQIGTSVNTRRTHGINRFEDIRRDLDEVLTRADEIRVLNNNNWGLEQLNRIIQLVGNIRISVNHIAGSTGVLELPSHTVPGVGTNPPDSTTQATTGQK